MLLFIAIWLLVGLISSSISINMLKKEGKLEDYPFNVFSEEALFIFGTIGGWITCFVLIYDVVKIQINKLIIKVLLWKLNRNLKSDQFKDMINRLSEEDKGELKEKISDYSTVHYNLNTMKIFDSLREITPIEIKWTEYNGFVVSILNIEWKDVDAALFGIYWGGTIHSYLYIDILFFTLKIKQFR